MSMIPDQLRHSHPDIAHINFKSSKEMKRANSLLKIGRFGKIEEMTHRTSVAEHELRVTKQSIIFSKILLNFDVRLNLRKILFFADRHDDPEILTDDIDAETKRNATPEEKAKMDEEERMAVEKLDNIIPKPLCIRSFPQEFEEYKAQKTIEARIVNYFDKWDGLHEAIHEVVCGNNRKDFKQVILNYKLTLEELNEKNKDWQTDLKKIFGDDFFDFPDPDKLVSKSPNELDYKTAGTFIESVAKGNPKSYIFWLMFTKSLFRIDFLQFTFPGWMDKFPKELLQDIVRVKTKAPFKKTHSGLLIPSTEKDVFNPTFGESLEIDTLESRFDMASKILSGYF